MGKAATAMSKGAIAEHVAKECDIKKSVAVKVIGSIAGVGTSEMKTTGIFTIPGLCRIKTRMKPATKAGKREVFGKMQIVKAKPAGTIVKAFPAAALKQSV